MKPPILVTGVAKRIGYALAQHIISQNIPVIGTYRTEHKQLEALAMKGVELHQCDFYEDGAVDNLIATVADSQQALRAIIHNASDWLPDHTKELNPLQVLDLMMKVHVAAPYQINLGLEGLLTNTADDSPGDIIHITDYVAERGSKKHIAYAASRAAQANMTLSFASRLAPKIKVNSIAPALIAFNDSDDESYKTKAMAKSPMRRCGGIAEVINAVDYLLNSNYITGRSLALDGGRHLNA